MRYEVLLVIIGGLWVVLLFSYIYACIKVKNKMLAMPDYKLYESAFGKRKSTIFPVVAICIVMLAIFGAIK